MASSVNYSVDTADYQRGVLTEVGVRFVQPPSGHAQIQLFKRSRSGFYVLSRVFAEHGSFNADSVEVLLTDAMEHARIHLETTSGAQLVLPV
jgi:hypothetical protein